MMPRWCNLWCQFDRGRTCDRLGKRCFVATTVIVPKLGGIRLLQAPGTDHRAGAACRPSGRCPTLPSSVRGKWLRPVCVRRRMPAVGPGPHAALHSRRWRPLVSGSRGRPPPMSPSPGIEQMPVSGAGCRLSGRGQCRRKSDLRGCDLPDCMSCSMEYGWPDAGLR